MFLVLLPYVLLGTLEGLKKASCKCSAAPRFSYSYFFLNLKMQRVLFALAKSSPFLKKNI